MIFIMERSIVGIVGEVVKMPGKITKIEFGVMKNGKLVWEEL